MTRPRIEVAPVERRLFDPEHDAFRQTAREFSQREIAPHHQEWERAGIVPRELWLAAGRQGLLGWMAPEKYGGAGMRDFRYNVVAHEELVKVGASGVAFPLANDITSSYLIDCCDDDQRRRWLPGFCDGSLITAIAMTEPDTGSDLQAIRTTATLDGDHYVLNGSKTFITNGINADLVIVVARTGPEPGYQGLSLLGVERGTPGFDRGRNLDKIGMKAQDTAELFFDDARVPRENLIGEEGQGFVYLMEKLPQERLSIAVGAVAVCEVVLNLTLRYAKERTAFGRPIGSFQANRFTLAELATETDVARVYVDRLIQEHVVGERDGGPGLSLPDAAKAKWWTTELQKRLVDTCLQLHGGSGYLADSPVAKAFLDTRVATIYGGTTEIMKEIVGRTLGL